ncbi:DnaK family protein, partial [Entamoeba invadens IP1]
QYTKSSNSSFSISPNSPFNNQLLNESLKKRNSLTSSYPTHIFPSAFGPFKAVITIPANFSSEQRAATKDAAEIAGIDVLELVMEPTAAAIAYDKTIGLINNNKYLVLDLGGGTFDVSVVDIKDKNFTVLSTDGDTHLGGKDIDLAILKYLVENNPQLNLFIHPNENTKRSPAVCARARRNLIKNCERAKMQFSTEGTANVEISLVGVVPQNAMEQVCEIDSTISAEIFEEICQPIFEKAKNVIQNVFRKKALTVSDIRDVILVGGPTRLCCFKKMIKNMFGKESLSQVDTMMVVCQGASIKAVETEKRYTDVVPISLGILSYGVLFEKIIESGTAFPTINEKKFLTTIDNQKVLSVRIFEGEKDICADNLKIGQFEIQIDKPQPKGSPIIVRFIIDSSGLFTVEAKMEGIGIYHSLIVEEKSREKRQEKILKLKEKSHNEEIKRQEESVFGIAVEILMKLRNYIEKDEHFFNSEQKGLVENVSEKDCETFEKTVQLIQSLLEEFQDFPEVQKFLQEEKPSLSIVLSRTNCTK